LTQLYFDAVARFAGRPAALRYKSGGKWIALTHEELAERVQAASIGLARLGLAAGDRIGILSENRPEWAIADFATLAGRMVDVPIYPTLTAHQVCYLLRDSKARAVFVSTASQLAKIEEVRSELPDLRLVVGFDRDLERDGVLSFDRVIETGRGAGADAAAWKAAALAVEPADLATVIYTSGTTGEPKGVMLTHGNIASNIRAAIEVLPVLGRDECLSLLPLSHIFERMTGHYSMFTLGVVINYAESLDAVPANLREVRPTVVAAVPRLYEKIYAKTLEAATHGSRLKRKIFLWAKSAGERWAERRVAGRVPVSLALQRWLADRLVFSRFRHPLGGRLRFFISGGAPLSTEIGRFFYAAGIPILEGYGLTETSPVVTVNTPTAFRFGTVGRPIPGVEVRIAADGEILVRGPNVMAGYLDKPEATAEAIDAEGWFHTGDIGELDEGGFLRITDRKKDLIATAGGKKIAPQPIENLLRQNPFIANAVMLGDRRKFPIALLVPNFERLEAWARAAGLSFGSREELVALPAVRAHLEGEAKKHFRDLARFEVPKKFLILARDFSVERGEVTPKLSIRRKTVEANFRDAIEELYRDHEE
jgi:long-chain acyl-CoA synthetase